jgi:hypothetical protein
VRDVDRAARRPRPRTVHLAHRHVFWTLTADLAAAVNPLLRPTATTVGHVIERWADEDTADLLGDRRLLATTVSCGASPCPVR